MYENNGTSMDMSLFNSVLQGVQTAQQGQQLALKKRELDEQAAQFAQDIANRKANTTIMGRQEDRLEKTANWEMGTKFPEEQISTSRGQDIDKTKVDASISNILIAYQTDVNNFQKRHIKSSPDSPQKTALNIQRLEEGFNSKSPGKKQEAISNYTQDTNTPSSPTFPSLIGKTDVNTGVGHWISKNIDSGQMIELEDGSLWEINPFNKIDCMLWLPISNITIIKNQNPYYPYTLINTDDGEKAEAKLLKP